jgi:hypothetical protein
MEPAAEWSALTQSLRLKESRNLHFKVRKFGVWIALVESHQALRTHADVSDHDVDRVSALWTEEPGIEATILPHPSDKVCPRPTTCRSNHQLILTICYVLSVLFDAVCSVAGIAFKFTEYHSIIRAGLGALSVYYVIAAGTLVLGNPSVDSIYGCCLFVTSYQGPSRSTQPAPQAVGSGVRPCSTVSIYLILHSKWMTSHKNFRISEH